MKSSRERKWLAHSHVVSSWDSKVSNLGLSGAHPPWGCRNARVSAFLEPPCPLEQEGPNLEAAYLYIPPYVPPPAPADQPVLGSPGRDPVSHPYVSSPSRAPPLCTWLWNTTSPPWSSSSSTLAVTWMPPTMWVVAETIWAPGSLWAPSQAGRAWLRSPSTAQSWEIPFLTCKKVVWMFVEGNVILSTIPIFWISWWFPSCCHGPDKIAGNIFLRSTMSFRWFFFSFGKIPGTGWVGQSCVTRGLWDLKLCSVRSPFNAPSLQSSPWPSSPQCRTYNHERWKATRHDTATPSKRSVSGLQWIEPQEIR